MASIGIAKEIKDHEYRVAIGPQGAEQLCSAGYRVLVEQDAGQHIGHSDQDYRAVGAEVVATAPLYQQADIIVKVKEPQPREYALLRSGQLLFSYLHLAANKDMTMQLLQREIVGVAFETVSGSALCPFPLLFPMSEIAGRLATQKGALYLERQHGGRGILLAGALGCPAAQVVVLGGGTAGIAAAEIAIGMGAHVTILEKSFDQMRRLDQRFGSRIALLYASPGAIGKAAAQADLLIGTVLIPGASAPKLLSDEQVSKMKKGAVIVDVAIDQGGCIATSRPTSHSDPIYVEHGVLHYCVTNMPAVAALSASDALEKNLMPYLLTLAESDDLAALFRRRQDLRDGLQLYRGQLTNEACAQSLDLPFQPLR